MIAANRIHEGLNAGVFVHGPGTVGRLESNKIWKNRLSNVIIAGGAQPCLIANEIWGSGRGIVVDSGGDPFLSGNTIRDHAGANGRGVLVSRTSHGLATILPDNVFLRNEGGDVFRQPPAPAPVVNGG